LLALVSAPKAIALVVAISALFCVLAFLGAAFTGAGHGSSFFFTAVLAPISASGAFSLIGLLFWPAVAVLLALRRFLFCRVAAALALLSHYVGIAIVALDTEWYYVGRVWHSLPALVVVFVALYLGGQVFMWWWIVGKQNTGLTKPVQATAR
jgi:hypothetical protein